MVQDARDGTVLMLGFMNVESLARTLETGDVWFWSRSRAELWHKGETSGNYLRLVEVAADCDGDALLVRALPEGPTCHTGARSCFTAALGGANARQTGIRARMLDHLAAIIAGRKISPEPGSVSNHLLDKGVDRIGRKIGEEAAETIIAAKNASTADLAGEVAESLLPQPGSTGGARSHPRRRGGILAAREGGPRRHRE